MATNFTRKVGYGLSEPLPIIGLEPIVTKRDPTTADKAPIGAEWINTTSNTAFILTSIEDNIATWISVSSAATSPEFVADSGTAIPVAGVLRVTGSGITSTSGSGNTLTINSPVTNYVTSSGTAIPSSNTINFIGGSGIATTGSGSTVTISSTAGTAIENIFTDAGTGASGTSITLKTDYAGPNSNGTSQFTSTGSAITLLYNDGSDNLTLGAIVRDGSPGGNNNVAIGVSAMGDNGFTGSDNTGVGTSVFENISSGADNTAVGSSAGEFQTTGTGNTYMGFQSGGNTGPITGSFNVEIGYRAGRSYLTSESSNIAINANTTTTTGESHVLRIGDGTGTGNQQLNSAFISGINGVNVGSVASVVSISGDHLGSATITAGTGISVTPTANTITIASTASSFTWNDVTGTSQAMAVNNGYIADNAGLVTLTLPSTAALGSQINVTGKGAGGWNIAQNAGQLINFGTSTTTTGTGGSLASTNTFDSVMLVCITANTTFNVIASVGNITIV